MAGLKFEIRGDFTPPSCMTNSFVYYARTASREAELEGLLTNYARLTLKSKEHYQNDVLDEETINTSLYKSSVCDNPLNFNNLYPPTLPFRRFDPIIYTTLQCIADFTLLFAYYFNTTYNNFSNSFLKNSKLKIKNIKEHFIIFAITNVYNSKSQVIIIVNQRVSQFTISKRFYNITDYKNSKKKFQ